jgi:hypothetical protein
MRFANGFDPSGSDVVKDQIGLDVLGPGRRTPQVSRYPSDNCEGASHDR